MIDFRDLEKLKALVGPPGYIVTQPGRSEKESELIKRDLGVAYVERRRHERTDGADGDASRVVAVYRTPKLKVVNKR